MHFRSDLSSSHGKWHEALSSVDALEKKRGSSDADTVSRYCGFSTPWRHHCICPSQHTKNTGAPRSRYAITVPIGSPMALITATHADLMSVGWWAKAAKGTSAIPK